MASASPRRAELLKQVGARFEVMVSDVDESQVGSEAAEELVQRLALAKARAVAVQALAGIVIGADTLVVQGGKPFGKPENDTEAAEMLRALSGRCHSVYTGVALLDLPGTAQQTGCAETRVFFRNLSEAEIDAYIRSGEGRDKAGAYGIQGLGALLVEKIEGDYFNVVGMPLQLLYKMLSRWQVNLLLGQPGKQQTAE